MADTTCNVLKRLIGPTLALQCNWKGKEKYGFSRTTVKQVVCGNNCTMMMMMMMMMTNDDTQAVHRELKSHQNELGGVDKEVFDNLSHTLS